MVQGDGERERARLGVIDEARPAGPQARRDGAAEVRLGVVAGVFGAGVQVTARHPDVDAGESERALHPGRVEHVRDGPLAQFCEAGVLDARLVDAEERASHDVAVPILADRRRHAGTRPHDRAIIPAALAEDLGVPGAPGFGAGGADAALLRILVRTVAPQRALRAVPDLAAVPGVEQAGDLGLAVPERGADAAGPLVVRGLYETRIRIVQRVAVRVHVQHAPRVALTNRAAAVG